MKKLITIGLLSLAFNSIAANCFLEKVDANGHFGPAMIEAKNMDQIPKGGTAAVFSDESEVYKMEITKMTQSNFDINVYQNNKLILQTSTIALNTNYQWVRSSVMPNADGSGVSVWCYESAH